MEIAISGALTGFYLITFAAAYVWETARQAVADLPDQVL